MSLYSSRYLKQLSANKSSSKRTEILNESKLPHNSFDIFLSHSYLDKEEVEGLYIELTNQGYSVYVDWIIDPHLNRDNVTKQSAELVRKRLKMSKALLLAISTNAAMSKWMPWELGYVDGNTNNCAIVPISKDTYAPNVFKGTEYLQLYPYVKRANINYRDDLYIVESANTYTTLNSWAVRGHSPVFNSTNIDSL